jgi:hypothetical protein
VIETIERAAVKRLGEVTSLPRPARHHNVLHLLASQVGRETESWEQGFVTSSGRFVDREEAFRIAVAAKQIIKKHPPAEILFSEDVW